MLSASLSSAPNTSNFFNQTDESAPLLVAPLSNPLYELNLCEFYFIHVAYVSLIAPL